MGRAAMGRAISKLSKLDSTCHPCPLLLGLPGAGHPSIKIRVPGYSVDPSVV